MAQVIRADIESTVKKLVEQLTEFHGWDTDLDTAFFGAKVIEMEEGMKLAVFATQNRVEIRILQKSH